MCGINGIFGVDKISDPELLVRRMNDSLSHRGPDAEGIYKNDYLVFGHRRLSIIDLEKRSNQPMTDVSGRYTLIFNGEIYNFQEIRKWIPEYPFKTSSDTETLLAAFAKWGIECLSRLNGMFAFAIWDDSEKKMFIARDRVGIKPLYYFIGQNSVLFSSEVRSLLSTGLIPKQIDPESLVDYLRYQTVHTPNTMIRNIRMLKAGCYLTVTDSDQTITSYWSPETAYSKKASGMDYEETKAEVARLFSDSVKKRLVSDVQFGAFLSGGIDSGAVVSSMAEHTSKLSTFSVTFDEFEYSEAKYAKIVADKYGTDHHEIRLTPNDFLKSLPHALAAMDHPSGDGPNTYVISEAVKKQGITMALSGLGGDELFAGYDVFKRTTRLNNNTWFMSFAPGMRGLAARAVRMMKRSVAGDKMYDILNLDYWNVEYTYPISRRVLRNDMLSDILQGIEPSSNMVHQLLKNKIAFGTAGFELPLLSKVTVAEFETYLQNVLLRDTDQMSMAHALEVRVPFLDHELVEYVLGVPDKNKFPSTPKRLLVESLGDKLPEEIVNRPKMGFTFPWDKWLKYELRDWTVSNLQDLGNRQMFDAKTLTNLWEKFESGDKRVTWSRIWYLAVLENWLKSNEINA